MLYKLIMNEWKSADSVVTVLLVENVALCIFCSYETQIAAALL